MHPTLHPRRASAVSVLQDDGRVDIDIHGKLRLAFKAESPFRKRKSAQWQWPLSRQRMIPEEKALVDFAHVPRMNIAILITGSRGDVQPFIALAKVLQSPPYSHRVRIVTHPNFKTFVEENGVEFYSMGGDPEKLMAYMVRNPSILPSLASMKAGDVGMRRKEIAEMLHGAWKGCTEAGDEDDVPFVADAIIANPPSYAHIHIAERLSIPLHLMFTMPWSPTGAFPHPLANLQSNKASRKVANWTSYYEIEMLTWEGLSDLINRFRVRTLDLEPLSPLWGHLLIPRLEVPFTYCWSEALIPKPPDWGPHINISGFFFLSLASSFTPPPELQAFLDAGPPPVYIGFGSIVVDDAQRLTDMVLEAVKISGVRALVSRGWGNMGGSAPPDNVFLLGNVPHDWLFPRVSAVVHHGGAGTTAIGIALGKPTVIVPFFGDQPWWASMVNRAGAGPEPVHFKKLTAEKLAHNITEALKPEMQVRAKELAAKIHGEDGPAKAAETFQSMPQMRGMACAVCPDRVAVWKVRETGVQLSAIATVVLVKQGLIEPRDLTLVRHKRWYVEEGPPDPIGGLIGSLTGWARAYQMILSDFTKALRSAPPPASKPTPSTSTSTSTTTPTHTRLPPTTKDLSSDSSSSSTSSLPTPHPSALKISSFRRRNHRHHPHKLGPALAALATDALTISLRAPVAVLYNVANGFHNAPSILLRDPTVRVRAPITDARSGAAAGAAALACGLCDAATGVVVLPWLGWRAAEGKEGKGRGRARAKGVARGVAQGVGGLVFKTGAAVTGPLGYGLKGVERQVSAWVGERRGKGWMDVPVGVGSEEVRARVRRACEEAGGHESVRGIVVRRVLQGVRELQDVTEGGGGEVFEEEVLRRWEGLERGRKASR
ncbi:glycosyltransferase family 1 protein [Neofusicoccum parvum]|nr:glycosyltransferase family 1 protein [Neofusicoccum parvum]